MSMMSAPSPAAIRAPSAICAGFAPGKLDHVHRQAGMADAARGCRVALGQFAAGHHLGDDKPAPCA